MTAALQPAGRTGVERREGSTSLADVVETILDKGLVIDAYVQVSLVGIELLTINARVVVTSVDTYLRFAEATNRLDLSSQRGAGLPQLVGDAKRDAALGTAKDVVGGVLNAAGDKLRDFAERSGERRPGSQDG